MTRFSRFFAGTARLFALAVLVSAPVAAQEPVIAPSYDAVGTFHNGVAPAAMGKDWGLIDAAGAWVVPPRFAGIGPGGDGLFAVLDGGLWGYIDSTGAPAITPAFADAGSFLNGVAAVRDSSGWTFILPDGSRLLPQSFDEIGNHDGTAAPVRDHEGWAVISFDPNHPGRRVQVTGSWARKDGAWLDDIYPTRLFSFSENAVVGAFEGGERLLSFEDRPVNEESYIEPGLYLRGATDLYPSVRRHSEGLSAVSTGPDQWGYLHRSGKVFWPGRFEDALAFADGYAPVKQGGLWGYIARNGEFVVMPQYDAAHPFRDGYAVIRKGDLRGFLRIDPDGTITEIVPPRFDDANRFSEGLAAVRSGGKWGFIADPDYRPLTEGETFVLVSE